MSASQLTTARAADGTGTTRARGPQPPRGWPASLVLGRYRLHRRLGGGAFGTVWKARDERLERDVAVKVLPRERIVDGRFEREARAAARLAHPGIVTLYEASVDDGGAYLVSELVRGSTLAALLDAGKLSDHDVIAIGIALCDALSHAHVQGVVHRDVKPSNILIPDQPADSWQLVKLTDFGVARVLGGDSLTRTGDVVGTAAYMAPEQAEGLDAGPAADLYALALVLYEALTGVNPVRTGTAAQRARRLGAYLPPLRRQRRELPRELGRAIDQALRPRPGERGTLQELRSALWQTLPAASDRPGIVTGRWQRRGEGTPGRATEEWRIEPEVAPDPPPAPMPRRRSRPGRSEDLAGRRRAWPDHALGAIAGAALCAWIARHLLATSLVAPAVLALLAGLVIAALPRLGWLALSAGIGAGAIAEGRPGAALLFLLAAILPAFVMPRDGAAWTLPAGGPALALIGLGGAWPALAARASGIWRRAALGGIGWIWLLMAAPVMGAGLYVRAPSGLAAQPGWPSSLHGTVALVLRPILTSGALAAAPVWALAAVTLPPLVRNRRPTAALALAAAWALGVVVAVQAAIGLADTSSWTLGSGPALIGVIASVAVVAAPSFRDALRVPRARPGLS